MADALFRSLSILQKGPFAPPPERLYGAAHYEESPLDFFLLLQHRTGHFPRGFRGSRGAWSANLLKEVLFSGIPPAWARERLETVPSQDLDYALNALKNAPPEWRSAVLETTHLEKRLRQQLAEGHVGSFVNAIRALDGISPRFTSDLPRIIQQGINDQLAQRHITSFLDTLAMLSMDLDAHYAVATGAGLGQSLGESFSRSLTVVADNPAVCGPFIPHILKALNTLCPPGTRTVFLSSGGPEALEQALSAVAKTGFSPEHELRRHWPRSWHEVSKDSLVTMLAKTWHILSTMKGLESLVASNRLGQEEISLRGISPETNIRDSGYAWTPNNQRTGVLMSRLLRHSSAPTP